MGRKIWLKLLFIVGFLMTSISGPAFASQLSFSPGDSLVYGLQAAGTWSGDIANRAIFSFDQTDRLITWGNRKRGIHNIPENGGRSQWVASTRNLLENPYDTNAEIQQLFQKHPTINQGHKGGSNQATEPNGGDAETVTSDNNAQISPKNSADDVQATSEPPSLPNALWLFGLGIIGIISVRRTSDHSNVT